MLRGRWSIDQHRGFPKVVLTADLADQKIRDIGAGDHAIAPLARLGQHLVTACARAPGQHAGTGDGPTQSAPKPVTEINRLTPPAFIAAISTSVARENRVTG